MSYGLLTTSITRGYESNHNRRKIYWQFPSGGAQLMGLLSLLPNAEETDKTVFGWYERRFPTQRTATVATGTAPFLNGDGTAFTDGANFTAGTEYIVKVLTTEQFKPTHVIEIRSAAYNSTTGDIKGVVTQIVSSTQLKFRPNSAWTAVVNGTTTQASKTVAIIGTANREYGRSGNGFFFPPINPENYTQIFRGAFAIPRSNMKGGLIFQKNGPFDMLAKENGLRYMMEMEQAFLWGQKIENTVVDPETNDQTYERQTGGVINFLEKWEEAGSIYRGSTSSAITSNDDSEKRIVDIGGALTKQRYNTWLQNLFRVTQDSGYEKVCLCGATFLSVINTLFDRDRIVMSQIEEPKTKAKFVVYSHQTLFGTVHYKTHPKFTEDPDKTNSGLFLDLGNLRYRPLCDSDTKFLSQRNERDRDGGKWEWISECGLEMKFPESCGYLKNVNTAG